MCVRGPSHLQFLLLQAPHTYQKSIFISLSSSNNSLDRCQTWSLSASGHAQINGQFLRPGSCRPSVSMDHTSRDLFCLCVLRVFLPVGPLSLKRGDLHCPFFKFSVQVWSSARPVPEMSTCLEGGARHALSLPPLTSQLRHHVTSERSAGVALRSGPNLFLSPKSTPEASAVPREMQSPPFSLTLKV